MKKILCATAIAAVLNLNAMDNITSEISVNENAQMFAKIAPLEKEINAETNTQQIDASRVTKLVVLLPEDIHNEILAAEEAVRIKKENYDNALARLNDALKRYDKQPGEIKELRNEQNNLKKESDELWRKCEEVETKIKELEKTQDKSIENLQLCWSAKNELNNTRKKYDEMLHKFFEVNSEFNSKLNEWEKDYETERKKASLECNEAEEAYKKSVEVYEELKLEGPNKVAFWEVYKMSRSSKEAAAVNLKDKLGLADDYEIRFMDANSLIEGMKFEGKEEFLRLLNVKEDEVEENVIPHIERYLNDVCTFSDKGLEKEVRNDVLKGCRQSKICRDNFITLIARVKMPQPFFSKKIFDLLPSSVKGATTSSSKHDGKLHFVRGKETESDYNIIKVGNEKKVYGRSLDSTSRISGRGFFYYSGVKSDVLSHEEGHSISADLAQYASTPATMDVVSKLAKFDKNEKNAARNRRYIESIAALPEKRKELLKWFPQAIEDKYKDVSDPNTLATALVDHQTSPTDVVENLFSYTWEIFQILGLGVFENGKKKVLCINLLSDLARNLEQGLPQRFEHAARASDLSFFSSPIEYFKFWRARCYNLFDLVDYSKTDAYDVLCNVVRGH